MFSPDSTLDEFTCAIAICEPEADLGTVLRIFQQTSCNSIAIPEPNNSWGVISSGNLLSLLAKSWQQLPQMGASYAKNSPDRDNFAYPTINNVREAIEPAIVCQAKTTLAEFFDSLQNNSFQTSQVEYFIVNSLGELKGKLDKDKLLKYLVSQHKDSIQDTNISLPNSLLSLLDLFDDLALPIKIENSTQQDCYVNRAWQQLVDSSQEQHLDYLQKSNVSIAHWWMERQFNVLQQNSAAEKIDATTTRASLCCLLDRASFVPPHTIPIFQKRDLKLQQSAIQCIDLASSPLRNLSSLEIKRGNQWDYLKIPLTFKGERWQTETKLYWLILAIESSLLPSNDSPVVNSNTSLKASTVDRLLATIAHELKSPLTGILGLSKLLNSEKIGILNQRQSFYISLIHNSGSKLSDIVSNLIELTSLSGKETELKSEAINLELLCHQLYQKAVTKLKSLQSNELESVVANTKLELNVNPEVKTAIADKLRLSSILMHLMLETIEFFEFSASTIQITIQAELRGIAIKISNKLDESSISPVENINAFSQEISLNLVIANYLAEILQGEIKSKYEINSCSFTLLLPEVLPQSDPSSLKLHSGVTKQDAVTRNLTILCLYPEPEAIDISLCNNSDLDFNLKKWAEQDWSKIECDRPNYRYRIIEADGLEQAHTLARIWQLDAVLLDGYQISDPLNYLQSLQKSEYLSALPIVTLDSQTTAAANQVEGLNVYPCLLPAECRSIQDLIQVIQIATGI